MIEEKNKNFFSIANPDSALTDLSNFKREV